MKFAQVGVIDWTLFMMNLKADNQYIFDTSVFIDLLRGRKAGNHYHNEAIRLGNSCGYSIITEMELWQGISGKRTVEQHKAVLKPYRRYFMNVTIARGSGTLRKDLRHKQRLGEINKIPSPADCIIAATAQFYNLTIVSKNSSDMSLFKPFGIAIIEYTDQD